ncbi:nocobactin polyketide synthase NbtC [Mycobacterium asiaticum]|uniref:nocobactin polyketide synthase NbtC n=1 Tax=Mycobacterium asiaticum TaxID=1790 RepID=UPI002647207D|nr:nocobactin polyketide synthase NbtC [Mycobacterium asiaticum]
MPNGAIPVLLTSDSPDLLAGEAAAVLAYVDNHLGVTLEAVAGMLFRTRVARKHRALAMVHDRDELILALQAVVDGLEHPSVMRTETAATARRQAYVFPGQGSQRPGMAKLFYDAIPAFRSEVDRCAAAFADLCGESPLNYLLGESFASTEASQDVPTFNASTVQPALFAQMVGLAAMWRSFGVAPAVTVGHSQGEIAAAYVSGLITLTDAVRIVAIRSRAADELAPGDYAMAVVAANRETCEELLARCPGWAQVSVVNSPNMTGVSGGREAVQSLVATCTERGIFARVIPVQYPAHTGLISDLDERIRTSAQRELENPKFLDTDVACIGATLGGPITQEVPVDQYWFWNLRNTVRFDKAITAALEIGSDTFVELAEHPTLQLAIQENLVAKSGQSPDGSTIVVGTSNRTAHDLDDFTRNLVRAALHDLDYSWEALATETDGPAPLPLRDFPNTLMNEITLWMPYEQGASSIARKPAPPPHAGTESTPARLLAEKWVRLSRRSLVAPRTIGIIDHTGACADLAAALCAVAGDVGATAHLVGDENTTARTDFDTYVILLPPPAQLDAAGSVAELANFFAERTWWRGVGAGVTDCWLVTVGGESVVADDLGPNLVHAAASAGFRSIGARYPGTRFRHLDLLPAGAVEAVTILAALHTAQESELALRGGVLYAKRVVDVDLPASGPQDRPARHVLIVGGTGKLGLEFCEHFARAGTPRITLVSRSGETAAVAGRLADIRSATSAQIQVAACDLADEAAVSALAQRGAPADLIIHAAVEYSGIELEEITADKVHQALQAKVVGAARVVHTFPRTENCRVLLCSSISASVGGRGLALYAAGNRMLDALAQQLSSEGLDCISVQWGHWDVHLDESGLATLSSLGVVPMRPAEALAVDVRTLPGNAIVAAFDLDRARSVLETCGRSSLLAQISAASVAASGPIERSVAPSEAQPGLAGRLVDLLAQAIGVANADMIDTAVPMVAIGLDSLQALEFRRRVKAELNHDLEVADLLGGASIAEVLAKLDA